MPVHDDLGIRMKEFYEQVPKTKLMRRTPVIIRLDGKAFHTFTRGFDKPFDEILIKAMQETTKYLCENIQGCVLGYTQSDEITLVLVDYKKLNSAAWFDYEVQKMCSVAASMATMAFNNKLREAIDIQFHDDFKKRGLNDMLNFDSDDAWDKAYAQLEDYYDDKYYCKVGTAMFDARCFNIPKEEVTNCIYWRQLDATRNSIQMVGQANFSHKELQGKSCNMIQDMLMTQKNINWNNLPTYQKRGTCCVKQLIQDPRVDIKDGAHPRPVWVIDKEIPIFKGDGRKYIDDLVFVGEA